MKSQLQLLREGLAELEAKYPGQNGPMVQGLKAQIASAERRQRGMFADNPMGEGRSFDVALTAGMAREPEADDPMQPAIDANLEAFRRAGLLNDPSGSGGESK